MAVQWLPVLIVNERCRSAANTVRSMVGQPYDEGEGQSMLSRIKVMDIDLDRPLSDIEGLDGYAALQGLVRIHDTPIGYVKLPVTDGRCAATTLRAASIEHHSWAIMRHLLADALAVPQRNGAGLIDWPNAAHPVSSGPLPLVTVAVCTRDRTALLAGCLDSLGRLDYPALDLLVVDNAPSDPTTARLVGNRYPQVRYVCEPRPGLNWARNRAIAEAQGEIIAYTDDDVVVDPGWVKALARVFAQHPEVMAVTGLVVPYELETEAQMWFERYGGFGRGFERQWYRRERHSAERSAEHIRAGRLGTGANMAYHHSLFDRIGGFDPALDVGTVTNGGGDLEMFFRVLQEGQTLVYEPSALVRHRHRRDYAQLRTQITDFGVGFSAYLVRSARAYPDQRPAIVRLGLWRLWRRHIRRLLISLIRPTLFPRDLILAELYGSFIGLVRYRRARRTAAEIAQTFGPIKQAMAAGETELPRAPAQATSVNDDYGYRGP
jgi:GT2 family glycosyltransferase